MHETRLMDLVIRGGTAVTDSYRVIGGASTLVTDQGDPFTTEVPDAQLLTCRRMIDEFQVTLDAASPKVELPFEGIRCHMGMAVHFNVTGATAGAFSLALQFEPDVAGGTRKTRRSMPQPIGGNFPL